ncbi:MAG: hypothetical protein AB7W28_04250 [Armatimonadota bacterium]
MSSRRGLIVAALATAITLVAGLVVVGQLRAQPPGPSDMEPPAGPMGPGGPPPGMEGMGMPGMEGMPGMGGAAAGAPLKWSEEKMPEELTMTYDEFLASAGVPRANIPDVYLKDKEGAPSKRTRNAWWELHRIYSPEIEMAAEKVKGTPGRNLEATMLRGVAAKENEVEMVRKVYNSCLDLFSFEMSGPCPREGAYPLGDSGGFDCFVAVRVKSNNVRRLLKSIETNFARFSHHGYFPGLGRRAYRLVTYERGVWQPKFYWLSNEALSEWDRLWSAGQLRLRAYGADGTVLAECFLSLGHNGSTPGDLLYPPDLVPDLLKREQWALNLDYVGAKRGFDGGPGIKWSNPLGWLYVWGVSGPMSNLSQVDAAEVAFVGADGKIGSRRVFGGLVKRGVKLAQNAPDTLPLTSSLTAGAALPQLLASIPGAGGLAGAAMAPGAPGMPSEMMGMMGGGMPSGMPGPGSMPIGPGYAPSVPPTAALMPGL